jgi:4-oxalmesaconate hydratase
MVGAVKGVDPQTGHNYDDTARYVHQVTGLSDQDRWKIFEGNARKVYGPLNSYLERRERLSAVGSTA